MHVEFLVEELSAEVALRNLVPRMLPAGCSFAIHPFQGKINLLGSLEARLRAYRAWIPADWRIVVLVDRDSDDCSELKDKLEQMASRAGLTTRASGSDFVVANRIAVEELEAWFFGDIEAVTKAYPRVHAAVARRAKYRHPDGIAGTWEALEHVLQSAGYFRSGLAKVSAASNISTHMLPERNTSPSFKVFARTISDMFR